LRRAECCNGLIAGLVEELQQAARAGDTARVAELGAHLRALLEEGLLPNVEAVRRQTLPGTLLEQKLENVRAQTVNLLQSLELQDFAAEDRQGIERVVVNLREAKQS